MGHDSPQVLSGFLFWATSRDDVIPLRRSTDRSCRNQTQIKKKMRKTITKKQEGNDKKTRNEAYLKLRTERETIKAEHRVSTPKKRPRVQQAPNTVRCAPAHRVSSCPPRTPNLVRSMGLWDSFYVDRTQPLPRSPPPARYSYVGIPSQAAQDLGAMINPTQLK